MNDSENNSLGIDKKNASRLTQVLTWCATADPDILFRCPSHEWKRYTTMGMAVCLTTLLGSLSGGYAIYSTFNDPWITGIFAVLWGALIFNFDRNVISNIRVSGDTATKTEIKAELDDAVRDEMEAYRKAQRLRNLWRATPRLIIALLLAVVVARPIELRLFSGRVGVQLNAELDTALNQFNKHEDGLEKSLHNQIEINQTNKETRIQHQVNNDHLGQNYQQAATGLTNEIETDQRHIDANNRMLAVINQHTYLTEAQRREQRQPYVSSRSYWFGQRKAANARQRMLNGHILDNTDSLASIRDTLTASYERLGKALKAQLDIVKKERPVLRKKLVDSYTKSVDILAQSEALGKIATPYNTAWLTCFLLSAIIVCLEISPVLIKLLAERCTYDIYRDAIDDDLAGRIELRKEAVKKEFEVIKGKMQAAADLKGQIYIDAETAKSNAQLTANAELLEKVVSYQNILAEKYLDAWYEDETDKFDQQAEEFKKEKEKRKKKP